MRGVAPFRPEQDAYELHVSHWSGPLPVSRSRRTGRTGGTLQGSVRPSDLPRRCRCTASGRPLATKTDPYARFVYIDTFNSVYGPGWKRDTGIVTHRAKRGLLLQLRRAERRHRVTRRESRAARATASVIECRVMGPGVTPVVEWEGEGLHRYDAAADRVLQQALRPAGRAGRQGLHAASARGSAESFEPFRFLRLTTSTQSTRAPRGPSRAKLDEPLRPRRARPRTPPRRSRPACFAPSPLTPAVLRAAAGRLAEEDALDVTLERRRAGGCTASRLSAMETELRRATCSGADRRDRSTSTRVSAPARAASPPISSERKRSAARCSSRRRPATAARASPGIPLDLGAPAHRHRAGRGDRDDRPRGCSLSSGSTERRPPLERRADASRAPRASNRPPTRAEIEAERAVPRRAVRVPAGDRDRQARARAGIGGPYVRHPSHGGAVSVSVRAGCGARDRVGSVERLPDPPRTPSCSRPR